MHQPSDGVLAFLDTNMLVSLTQNSHIGAITQYECFRVAVEYRLYNIIGIYSLKCFIGGSLDLFPGTHIS